MLSHEYVCKEKTKNNTKNRSMRTRFRSHRLLVHLQIFHILAPECSGRQFWPQHTRPGDASNRRPKGGTGRLPRLCVQVPPCRHTVRKLHQLQALQAARGPARAENCTGNSTEKCGQLAAAASKALRSCAASESACPRGGARANAHLAQLRLHVLQHLVQSRRARGSR